MRATVHFFFNFERNKGASNSACDPLHPSQQLGRRPGVGQSRGADLPCSGKQLAMLESGLKPQQPPSPVTVQV